MPDYVARFPLEMHSYALVMLTYTICFASYIKHGRERQVFSRIGSERKAPSELKEWS